MVLHKHQLFTIQSEIFVCRICFLVITLAGKQRVEYKINFERELRRVRKEILNMSNVNSKTSCNVNEAVSKRGRVECGICQLLGHYNFILCLLIVTLP